MKSDYLAVCYFSLESGVLGVGELETSESFAFLSEDFGPVMTNTMPSKNSIARMVSIIKGLGNPRLGIGESSSSSTDHILRLIFVRG